MSCELCNGTGLDPIFEHVSHPAHAPAQKRVVVEPYDFAIAERQWEENGLVHQLLESFQTCRCLAGQARDAARAEQSSQKTAKGWAPSTKPSEARA